MTKITAEKPTQVRDPVATQKRILKAAKREFAQKGLGGARIDIVAEKAKSNKRMIYHYFGSKEELFQKVVEDSYLDIREAEKKLHLERLPPQEAIETLVRFTWHYYLKNPEFLTLVNSENLHRAVHLKKSEAIKSAQQSMVSLMGNILKRGAQEGIFRPGVDPEQLIITIAAVSYYYFTNKYTGAILFDRNFMGPDALQKRLDFNIDTIMRILKP
ncbi:TetR family transcriptional regulator [Gibbsiella quercinecans]|uniref:TetR family transcriptional regulator n=1 Tax=Gibbsiella quercinecans TaxID=929813 RepID=A0A250AWV3_9GAMM|nr:TetR/AcrR family transcriptional regulator [Gibbsiella quercinecans]ATA18453.1 TetR family transcriptional regulator [Gibbsiella quercinecans]RLM13173.1 TetR family transcriptional regulator [Gibbsiella quercinecans]RLM14341.1 TetR family transcriptional regulator [Gibbsiella quercinecans]TCT91062.1 TetR family transcriptional regulator [Gibbsiella quercinecans]